MLGRDAGIRYVMIGEVGQCWEGLLAEDMSWLGIKAKVGKGYKQRTGYVMIGD